MSPNVTQPKATESASVFCLLYLALPSFGVFCPARQPAARFSALPACVAPARPARVARAAQPSHAQRSQAKSMPPTLLPSSSRRVVRGTSDPGANHKQKADSTLRSSRAVPHPSTNRALRRFTSEVKRDPVHSTRYGRQRWRWGGGWSRAGLGLVTLIPRTGALVH